MQILYGNIPSIFLYFKAGNTSQIFHTAVGSDSLIRLLEGRVGISVEAFTILSPARLSEGVFNIVLQGEKYMFDSSYYKNLRILSGQGVRFIFFRVKTSKYAISNSTSSSICSFCSTSNQYARDDSSATTECSKSLTQELNVYWLTDTRNRLSDTKPDVYS